MKKKIQKPFDAEAAKNGAKVETREGRSVRILCYDRATAAYPIIGLVNYESVEHCFTYTIEGKVLIGETSENDLVIIEEVEETKFNVGDWVFATNNGKYPWLITARPFDYYELQDADGLKTTASQITIDNKYHLWTLKDAKPGDVLIRKDDGRPFIFKGCVDENHPEYPVAYCGINDCDGFIISTGKNRWVDGKDVRPATSNEKDMLFKKLEEEGYKWDAETLTLSKIQKRWRDNENAYVSGYYINNVSQIIYSSGWSSCLNHNMFATEKQAKSALAMARISQIMANDERFGGAVTDKEWKDKYITKFVIRRFYGDIICDSVTFCYNFLAFHTEKQAKLFLEENEDLVKDYYMLD